MASWSLVVALLAGVAKGGVPEHSMFIFDGEDKTGGILKLKADQKMRLNVKGGEPKEGDPLILWGCSPQAHELFKLDKGHIELVHHPGRCLNVHGGPSAGHKIISWPCNHLGKQVDHEQFIHGTDGRITLKSNKKMCVNVKGGGVELGAELVLWPCADKPNMNEVFNFNNGLIQVRAHPDFHFNVAGANVTDGHSNLVLWTCSASPHELFKFTKAGELQLVAHPHLCLNAEGGLSAGHRIVVWPCSGKANPNEQWKFDKKHGQVYSTKQPTLGFNVRGAAMGPGSEIVLWPRNEKSEL